MLQYVIVLLLPLSLMLVVLTLVVNTHFAQTETRKSKYAKSFETTMLQFPNMPHTAAVRVSLKHAGYTPAEIEKIITC